MKQAKFFPFFMLDEDWSSFKPRKLQMTYLLAVKLVPLFENNSIL